MRVLLALLLVGIAGCGPSIRPTYTLEGHTDHVVYDWRPRPRVSDI